jgi:uncharacterized protein (DUF1501 family)
MNPAKHSRREFLRTAARLSVLGPAGLPFAVNLATINAAAAQSATGYRALVCVFLFGGNDQGNTVLATDPGSWTEYTRLRGTGSRIALPAPGQAEGVLPIAPLTAQAGRSFALHPGMAPMKNLFDAGRAAVVANVGPLIVPLTKAQYASGSTPKPRNLFSHNDQQSTWQAYAPEGSSVGWGGRMGDILGAMNSTRAFTAISVSGSAVWLSGRDTTQYQVGSNGATGIGGIDGSLFGSRAAADAFRAIVTADSGNLLAKTHSQIARRTIDAQASMSAAMLPAESLEALPQVPGSGAENSLAAQLRVVARIIGGRGSLGVQRQVFFVSLGGFDNHDSQLGNQGRQLATLAQAVEYFDRLMASPAVNAANEVTLFTASDFGRTGTSNGDGTDHGWGSHHFVAGGAVKGGDVYGRFPVIGSDTEDDVGNGRLLPGTAVDQYAATLARWFGVSDVELDDVLPNLRNFTTRDLGFMKA